MENPVTLDLSQWDLCILELALRRLEAECTARGDSLGVISELKDKISAAITR